MNDDLISKGEYVSDTKDAREAIFGKGFTDFINKPSRQEIDQAINEYAWAYGSEQFEWGERYRFQKAPKNWKELKQATQEKLKILNDLLGRSGL